MRREERGEGGRREMKSKGDNKDKLVDIFNFL